jgi:thiol-disulfide isomerase/thioredoxin
MVQSPKCGHCTSAKPAFQAFAELCSAENKIKCFTIHVDNERLIDLVLKIKPSFDGYPDYFKFKNGTLTSDTTDGRDVQSLLNFSK